MPSLAPPASAQAAIRSLLAPADPALPVRVTLGLAAVAVGVAGFLHGRLFHEGYGQVPVIGPLFLLNEISSGVVIALLCLRRPWLFAMGALGISVGAVVSIVISHTTSLFGFAEHRYDARATAIVAAECAAIVLVLLALGLAARLGLGAATPSARMRAVTERAVPLMRGLGEMAAVAVLAGAALVAAGVGQGSPPPALPLSARAARSEIRAVAHGRALALRGERLFGEHGCGDCHTLAAGGYGGRLGPRLDAILQGIPASRIEQDILHPPHSIPGYEAGLMPENFGSRLPRADVRALAAFLATAARGAAGSGR